MSGCGRDHHAHLCRVDSHELSFEFLKVICRPESLLRNLQSKVELSAGRECVYSSHRFVLRTKEDLQNIKS